MVMKNTSTTYACYSVRLGRRRRQGGNMVDNSIAARAASSDRRYDLDWIRIGVVGLVLLYHCGMVYMRGVSSIKSDHVLPWLAPLMLLVQSWMMPLLMLVSGAATRFMADRSAPAPLARSRLARLAPPLILAILVVVPPQTYFQVVDHFGYSGSYGAFWARYLTNSGQWCDVPGAWGRWADARGCIVTPTWNHMWFVAYLIVYTLILLAMIKILPRLLTIAERGLVRLCSGPGLIIGPVIYVTALRFILYPMFPETKILIDDWYLHALFLGAFLFGFLIAKSEAVRANIERLRWVSLGLALFGYVVYLAFFIAYQNVSPKPQLLGMFVRVCYGVNQWCSLIALMGFASRHWSRAAGPARSYLSEAVFPVYLVHQTLIVILAFYLARAGLPVGVEALLLVAGVFAGSVGVYFLVRPVPWLRPLFGLGKLQSSQPKSPARLAEESA
jgi:glucans biosynthesis protein C